MSREPSGETVEDQLLCSFERRGKHEGGMFTVGGNERNG